MQSAWSPAACATSAPCLLRHLLITTGIAAQWQLSGTSSLVFKYNLPYHVAAAVAYNALRNQEVCIALATCTGCCQGHVLMASQGAMRF